MEAIEAGAPGRVRERFEQLYSDHARRLTAYVVRRIGPGEDSSDLVAEVFLAAWRRAEEIPADPTALLWLFGIARGMLANSQRGERRRARLQQRLQSERSTAAPGETMPELETSIGSALERLDPKDREVLMLAGWEGLEPAEIAGVLGIKQVTARSRLHRAKRRLERELAAIETDRTASRAPELEGEEP